MRARVLSCVFTPGSPTHRGLHSVARCAGSLVQWRLRWSRALETRNKKLETRTKIPSPRALDRLSLPGQKLRPSLSDHHYVLKANSELPGNVDPRFVAECHARLKRSLIPA